MRSSSSTCSAAPIRARRPRIAAAAARSMGEVAVIEAPSFPATVRAEPAPGFEQGGGERGDID